MKKILTILLLLSNMYAVDLDWLHNYDEALKQAKIEKKKVYLFIGADVCRWCDRFKEMTLSKPEVIDRLKENYILLYMSRDRHKIPSHFEVKGVPRHYFLDSAGKIIFTTRGSREVEGFYDLLEEVDLEDTPK